MPRYYVIFSYERAHFLPTENMRKVYNHIKVLRKVSQAKNISNFMVKKLLMKEKFQNLEKEVLDKEESFFDLLVKILSEPEMQKVFGNKIGFTKEEEGIVILDN